MAKFVSVQETRYPDGKVEKVWSSGRMSVVFSNGTLKDTWPDGLCVIHFKNGDVKKTFADGASLALVIGMLSCSNALLCEGQ